MDGVLDIERNDTPLDPHEVTEYRYDPAGNLDKVRLDNGVVNDYDYDEMNRLVQLKVFEDDNADWLHDGGEDLLAQYEYDLLFDGTRSGVTETDDDGAMTRIDWFYDDLGRLTREVYDSPGSSLDFVSDYIYDLVGNRLEKQTDKTPSSGEMTAYHPDAADGAAEVPLYEVNERITSTFDANDRLLVEKALNHMRETFPESQDRCCGARGPEMRSFRLLREVWIRSFLAF